MDKPYKGLRVIDFTTTIAGPQCTRMLADMGADVIKIETRDGDMMRSRPPQRNGASTAFGQLNAGKRSVVIDLKSAAGRQAARRLAQTGDVLVENFRPGVMQRLGLDYESLRAESPRLIYCAISGYGQSGPSSQLPAYAPVIHAASGFDLAHLSYQDGRERPDYCGIFVADVLSGVYAFGAIGTALHQRHQTGCGQFIDVSMLESMLSLTLTELQAAQFSFSMPRRPMFGPVETCDGYVMVAVASEKTFVNFVQAAGQPELVRDPRFEKYLDRRTNWPELMDLIENWSRKLTSEQCLSALELHGVPSSPYRTVKQALDDPQLAHRRALTPVSDLGGEFKVLNTPFRLSQADTNAGARSPALGEHTREVLHEIGYDSAQITELDG
ncbi:MAG: CaiB/BaiF CoA-transferase family protein [Quisquiliibacterium sp.]